MADSKPSNINQPDNATRKWLLVPMGTKEKTMSNNNELAYDENYTVDYYTIQEFIAEYPELIEEIILVIEEEDND
jgi:hypothetical protein